MPWRNYFRVIWVLFFPLDVLLKVMVTCSSLLLNYTGIKRGAAWVLAPRIKKKKIEKLSGSPSKRLKADDGKQKPKKWRKTLVLDPIPALCHVSTELPTALNSNHRTSGSAGETGASAGGGIDHRGRLQQGDAACPTGSHSTQEQEAGMDSTAPPPPPPTFADIVIENNKGKPVYVWVRPHAEQLLRAMARCGGYDDIVVFSMLPPPIVRVVMNRMDPGRKLVRRLLFPYSSRKGGLSSRGLTTAASPVIPSSPPPSFDAVAHHPLVMNPPRPLFPPASSKHPAVLLSGKREATPAGTTSQHHNSSGDDGGGVSGHRSPFPSLGDDSHAQTNRSEDQGTAKKECQRRGSGELEARPKMEFASLYTSTSSSSGGMTTHHTTGSDASSSLDTIHLSVEDMDHDHDGAKKRRSSSHGRRRHGGQPLSSAALSSSARSSSIASLPSLSSPPEPRAFTPPPPTSPLEELPVAAMTQASATVHAKMEVGVDPEDLAHHQSRHPSSVLLSSATSLPVPTTNSSTLIARGQPHSPMNSVSSLNTSLEDSLQNFATSTTCTTTFHSASPSLTSLSADEEQHSHGGGSPLVDVIRSIGGDSLSSMTDAAVAHSNIDKTELGSAETTGSHRRAAVQQRRGSSDTSGGTAGARPRAGPERKKKRRVPGHACSSSSCSSSSCSGSSSTCSSGHSSPLHALEVDPRHVVILSSNREMFMGSCFEDNVLCIEPYNPLAATVPSSSEGAGSTSAMPILPTTSSSESTTNSAAAAAAPKKRRGFLGGRKEVDDKKKVLKTVEPILRALAEVEDVREVLRARKS